MQAACNSQEFPRTEGIYWPLKFLFIITTDILNWTRIKEHFVLKTILKKQSHQAEMQSWHWDAIDLQASHAKTRPSLHIPKHFPQAQPSQDKARTGVLHAPYSIMPKAGEVLHLIGRWGRTNSLMTYQPFHHSHQIILLRRNNKKSMCQLCK